MYDADIQSQLRWYMQNIIEIKWNNSSYHLDTKIVMSQHLFWIANGEMKYLEKYQYWNPAKPRTYIRYPQVFLTYQTWKKKMTSGMPKIVSV